MLRVSGCMSRRFNLKEGFLLTDTVKHAVKRCISEEPMTNFPGAVSRRWEFEFVIEFSKNLCSYN